METALTDLAGRINGVPDHLGIAVADLDAAARFYRDVLGLAERERRVLTEAGLSVVFLAAPSIGLPVELIAPLPGAEPLRDLVGRHTIQDFLATHPLGGLHHVCFRVADLDHAIAVMAAEGVPVLGDGRGAVGASGRRIVFLAPSPPAGLLIELKDAG